MQPDFFDDDDEDLTPIDKMDHDRLAQVIKGAIKSGKLTRDGDGPAFGFLRMLKLRREPSERLETAARNCMKRARRIDPLEDQRLIDTGDTLVDEDDAPALVGDEWEEFR